MIRHTVNGVTLTIASKHELAKASIPTSEAYRLSSGAYLLTRHLSMSDVAYAAGLVSFDYALPQSWFDEYMKEHGTRPQAVWCYDTHRVMGAPMFLSQMLALIDANLEAHVPFKIVPMEIG